MKCEQDHGEVKTTYCGSCGKRVGYNRPNDLLAHLRKSAEQAAKKTTPRGKRDAEKWKAWAAWVEKAITVSRTG